MKMSSFISISLLVLLVVSTTGSAWNIENGIVREWGAAGLTPYGIETLSDGSVWFASDNSPSVFIINQETGVVIPYTASFDGDFTTMDRAPDDTLWISDENDRIVHFSPCDSSGSYFTEYPIDRTLFTPDASPYGIRVAPDGKVWFTRWPDPSLGWYNPTTGTWDRFVLPEIDTDDDGDDDYPGTPAELAFDDDGNVYFTMNKLIPAPDSGGEYGNGWAGFGKFDPVTETFTLYNDPALYTPNLVAPWEIIFTSYNPDILWFTDKTANYFIRVDLSVSPPGIEEYVTPFSTLPPEVIDTHFFAIDPDGIFWLAPYGIANIGTFNPTTHDFETRSLESGRSFSTAVSPVGEVWWTIPAGVGDEQPAVARFIPFTDTDGDGIDDDIDSAPAVSSGSFSDGTTSGALSDPGDQTLVITDATEPFGIRMMADCGGGAVPAVISCCDPLIQGITLDPCDDILVTCGSNTIRVFAGPVEIELEHGVVLIASTRSIFTVTGLGGTTYRIENIGCPDTGAVTVGIHTVAPGESITVTPPVAEADGPYTASIGEAITFDSTGSSDPDGTIEAYDWDWGDGTAHGSGESPTHAYTTSGTLTVTLTVTDNDGITGSDTGTVTITTPCQDIDDLKATVMSMTLKPTIRNALNTRLNKASKLCAQGPAKYPAIATLFKKDFIPYVNSKTGRGITPAQATVLINQANLIITACGG